jgi:PAS domain S-box-containing protein
MPEKVRVLYMEDNEGTARLLEKRLSRAGYEIETAPDGEVGLEQCAARAYDALIVDYDLPGMNGIQIIQRLTERDTTPPTIMLTGAGNEQIAVEALKLGAFDYVIKDIDGIYFELLPTVIEQALKNQQLLEDKRRTEEALLESEERFRLLFEEAPDPYFVADLAGNLIDCNRAAEPLIGLNIDELIGKNYEEMQLFVPDQLEQVANVLTEMSEGVFTRPAELTINRPDGGMVIVEIRTIPVQIKGQTQILGIGHDITWRKQAEAQMKAYIEQLETLHRIDDVLTRELDTQYVQSMALENMMRLSGANAGSLAVILGGEILNIHSVGYPEELNQYYSLDGRSIVARVAREHKAEWVQDVAGDPDYFSVLADTCSQITLPLLSQERLVGLVSLETNQPECFNAEMFEFLKLIAARIAIAIDNAQLYDSSQKQLVQLRELYDQISELEQLKTDMIRLAAHDLRNPLSAILMKTALLRKTLEEQLSQKQQDYINSIDGTVEQMNIMISGFLSLERIEVTTQGELEVQEVNLRDLVQGVFANYRAQAEEKAHVYRFSSPETPLLVRGNEAELQQVIANLIGNAIKYTPGGGIIEAVLQRQDMVAQFEVIDTGYGIPIEQQEKLFQPFFRVQLDETRAIEGTGLGLYLVKKTIERNGGQIAFHSEYGKGSTFGFTLPLVLDEPQGASL